MNSKFTKSKMTITDLFEKFFDENKCREFLFELRFAKGFACSNCGGSRFKKRVKRSLSLQGLPQADLTDFRHFHAQHAYQAEYLDHRRILFHERQEWCVSGQHDEEARCDLQNFVVSAALFSQGDEKA